MTQVVSNNRLVQPIYTNDKGIFDYEALTNALQTAPDLINKQLIWAAGQYYTEDFAISKLTEGVGNKSYVTNFEYEYPFMTGDLDGMDTIVSSSTTTNAGLNFQPFTITFKHRHFKFQNTIISPSRVQMRVMDQPVANGSFYDYRVMIMGSDATAYVSAADLAAGAQYERGPTPVEYQDSVGTEDSEMYPSKAKNQISTLRASWKLSGDIANFPIQNENSAAKFAKFTFPMQQSTNEVKTLNYWADWSLWQFYLRMRRMKEIDYWVSEYNKMPDGTIPQRGPSGNPILRGDGLLAQITNVELYPKTLTAARLRDIVMELFFNTSRAESKHIQLHTGTGGMRIFDEAMLSELKTRWPMEQTNNVFVSKTGDTLQLGKYFTTYKTPDGHYITVHKNPLFDLMFRNGPKYKGLHQFSYEMIFVDMSTYDGTPNLQVVTRKTREMKMKTLQGMADLPKGFTTSDVASTDKDRSSIEFMFDQGLSLYDTTSCLRLQMAL